MTLKLTSTRYELRFIKGYTITSQHRIYSLYFLIFQIMKKALIPRSSRVFPVACMLGQSQNLAELWTLFVIAITKQPKLSLEVVSNFSVVQAVSGEGVFGSIQLFSSLFVWWYCKLGTRVYTVSVFAPRTKKPLACIACHILLKNQYMSPGLSRRNLILLSFLRHFLCTATHNVLSSTSFMLL